MHQITIQFTRCMLPFKIKRQLPSNWAEVRKSQLVNAISYLLTGNYSGVFCEFAHISPATFKRIDKDLAFELVKLLDFTHQAPNRFFIEKIKVRIAPKNLESLTIGNLAYADSYFINFATAPKEETLNNLIACVYGYKLNYSKKYFWDKEMATETYFLRHLTYAEKLSIFYCYKGMREALLKAFNKVFEQTQEPNPTGEDRPKAPAQANPLHLFQLIETLSKSNQYGTYHQTFNTTAETILFNIQISK